MAYDLKRSYASLRLSRLLAAGTSIAQEGLLVCSVIEGGVEKAQLVSVVAGTEKVLGWVSTADSLPSRTSAVEEVTVPAAGTYEVTLRHNNIVAGALRALDVSAGTAVGTVTACPPGAYAGASGADEVKVDLAAGKLKFNVAKAGKLMRITYLYDLTLVQAKQLFGERFVNNRGLHAEFGQIEVQSGIGELYTDQFDASANWAAAATVNLGDNGQLVVGGAGPALAAEVVSVPSVDVPMLGIRYRMTP